MSRGAPSSDVRATALALLARREHSARELARKLQQRGHGEAAVAECLDVLQAERLLSDERFAESYVRVRAERGYGPLRIRAELQERGVAAELIAEALAGAGQPWAELAARERRKRFGAMPADFRERARQARFLQYRGFDGDTVRGALGDD